MIGVEIITDMDIVAVIAKKRLLYQEVSFHTAQQFHYNFLSFLDILWSEIIVIMTQFFALKPLGDKQRIIVCIIYHAGQHLFFLCHFK